MSDNTTLIDHESARKVLAALNGEDRHGNPLITGDAVANALANVLSRKLGLTAPALNKKSKRMSDKFECFFDLLFNVAYEEKPLGVGQVIELVNEAAKDYRQRAIDDRNTVHADPDDDCSVAYDEDAATYEEIAELLKEGRAQDAVRKWRALDTYTRGALFSNDPREQFQLSIFLDQYDD